MYIITAYSIYLFCSLITVLVVGKSLHRNGKSYLFGECPDEAMSTSANNFLYTGYCLVNSAFALFFLRTTSSLHTWTEVFEFISFSQGFIFLSLGLLHMVNIIFAPKIIQHFLNKKLLTHKNTIS
ncbi:MAG: hypothetical protein H0W61_14840 [Bacteroidetes bacterium]|nr:hypothetical protein [Bacteroidota bacterium]